MKKIILLVLLCAVTFCGKAQTHYKGSVNTEIGAGINDMACISPVFTLGYTFNEKTATYGRYSFASGSEPGYSFMENNIELYVNYTPFQIDERWFFSFNAGTIFKFQKFKDIIPSARTGNINIGISAGTEAEWAIGVYHSLFVQATYRMLFLDEKIRQEMFYCAGLRLSLNILNKRR